MIFLTGKDYPRLCKACQHIIDDIAQLYQDNLMEDTDDNEAPITYAYDHSLFCGGHVCVNHSPEPAKK